METCQICNKKLPLTFFTCKCQVKTCIKHRWEHANICQYDYKTAAKEELRKNNPVLISQKISTI